MARTKRQPKHDETFDTEPGVNPLYIDEDREFDEQALLGLLDPGFTPPRNNSYQEEFSWEGYLENSWSGRRY